MSEDKQIYEPSDAVKLKAYIKNLDEYKKLYQRSTSDLKGFWEECADQLDWYKKWDKVLEWDFTKPEVKWFLGGKLNASYNCLDRHLNSWRSNKVALIWQGEPLEENRIFTYQQLHYHVCKFANVLKKFGVKKGTGVSIYLPMIPELPMIPKQRRKRCQGMGFRCRMNEKTILFIILFFHHFLHFC
jgi:acetyl-CoA synthetase